MTSAAPVLLAQLSGGNAAIVTFAVYIVGVMVLAWLSNRLLQKKSFLSEYFLGSRGLGVWAFALTFAATSSSGGSFIGFPSLVYTHGWVVAMWIGSYMIVPIVSMGLLAKRINQVARRTGAITIPDVLRDRFESRTFGTVAILLIVFFMSFNLIAQFKGGSVLLNTLIEDEPLFKDAKVLTASTLGQLPWVGPTATDDPGYIICLIVFSLAVVVYTAWGGFRAVVWTDVMQGFVMVGGVLLMLPLALYAVGGLESATREMAEMTPPQDVQLRLEAAGAVNRPVAIPKNAWLVQTDQGRRRLFRTKVRCEIQSGDTVAGRIGKDVKEFERDLIPAIELTHEKHVQKIEAPQYNPPIEVVVLNQARVELSVKSPPEETTSIPGGTIVAIEDADGDARRFRTLADARIDAGEKEAIVPPASLLAMISRARQTNIPAVELTSDGGSSAAELPLELTVNVTKEFREVRYAHGADQAGAYVTAPGPSASSDAGFLPLSLAISFFCMWTFSGAGQPSNMVRLMAFKESKTLRRAIFTVSIYYSLIYFPLVVIFCCARVILPGWESESDRIMPEMAGELTRRIGMGWLGGLLVAAPFAAVMSTMDSFLLMISSALVRDVYQRNLNPEASEKTVKRLTYLVTVAVGVVAMLAAVNPPSFLQDIIVFTGSGLSTSFLAPVFLMLYWPRFNKQGALCGMLGGFATHITLYAAGFLMYGKMTAYEPLNFHPFLVGAAVSLLISLTVAMLTPPPPEHLVRKFFYAPNAK